MIDETIDYAAILQKVASERKNAEQKNCWSEDVETKTKLFQHKDFKKQFKDKDALRKALPSRPRDLKTRLERLAPFVYVYGEITRNYTKAGIVENDGSKKVLENPLFELEEKPTNQTTTNKANIHIPLVDTLNFNDVPTILDISSTNKRLLAIYKNQRTLARVIEDAVDCGLIQCVSSKYRFCARKTFSKRYAWNKVCEHQLRELMREHGIVKPAMPKTTSAIVVDCKKRKKFTQELYFKISLGTGMKTPGLKVEEINEILSYKYRELLRPVLSRNEAYNEGRPEEQQLHLNFNITMSTQGFNVKNGCRSSATVSSFKKSREDGDMNEMRYFDEYFEETFGDRAWEYDVKASIPMITRLVNKGIWDTSEDPYEVMFKGVDRKLAKSIYMPYQFEYTGNTLVNHVMCKVPSSIREFGKDKIWDVLKYYSQEVFEWEGNPLGNLAFLCEDGVYSKVDLELKKKGYKFIRKYDAWEFPLGNHPAEKMMDDLVKKCALEWYKDEWKKEKTLLDSIEGSHIKKHSRKNNGSSNNESSKNTKKDLIKKSPSTINNPISNIYIPLVDTLKITNRMLPTNRPAPKVDNRPDFVRDNSDIPDEQKKGELLLDIALAC